MNGSKQAGKRSLFLLSLLTVLSLFALQLAAPQASFARPAAGSGASMSVFATGLNNPRGLKFGPDGFLYVAEGGTGGAISTVGFCPQVIAPVGPYSGGYTASISKIDSNGARTTLVGNLPSSQTGPALGSLVSGVADVAFVGHQLYALLAGAGCSHGIADVPNGIIKVNSNGSWNLVANLSAYQMSHPVLIPEPDDFEPDGTWYSMIAVNGGLYAVEPNHGELDKITTGGAISRVVDISASQGHIVPTAVAYHGNFFVGNLTTFPLIQDAAKVLKITPSGQLMTFYKNLTNIVGLAFDRQGRLYVLENTVGQPMPAPASGRIVRIGRNGQQQVIAAGLNLPTAMTFGPDGALYVSVNGFGMPPGAGQVMRVAFDN